MLTNANTKFWAPAPEVQRWLTDTIPADAQVLEIGPGHIPFQRANAFVDFVDIDRKTLPDGATFDKVNLNDELLPFDKKTFDFVYCRHVLEDMFNPFALCKEMERVGKSGYIETPSPMAEMCRGIDGNSPSYRGYHHHRFIIWSFNDVLNFVTKYPVIEYTGYTAEAEDEISLKSGPLFWNTYHAWLDTIVVKHWQSPLDFSIPVEYSALIDVASKQSKMSTQAMWTGILERKKQT
jgi:SAM-dependent methyltransferase